jgi:manganese/zinc/iron transport system permease protein
MQQTFMEFFTDPILRGPTIGCMLMCFAAALVGVIVFLRRESLLGESLSHAAYPGVVAGIALAGALGFNDNDEWWVSLLVMSGAFCSALLGLWTIGFLERYLKVKSDAALCFVLSVFFGIGLTFASRVQFTHSLLFRQAQAYLFGQAATMNDTHIVVYGVLSLLLVVAIALVYKELQIITFDTIYAKSLGIPVKAIHGIVFILIVLALVIGIRSVGVVLMSAMLIAPATAARQFSNRLYVIFPLAAFFGLLSGFLGNYLSLTLSDMLDGDSKIRLFLPTGPMIVMVATCICFFALLFAPQRGVVTRAWRIASFRFQTICDNVIKSCWRLSHGNDITIDDIARYQTASKIYLKLVLANLTYNGWLRRTTSGRYRLTHEGKAWGAKIVRLHRLWEVYLVDYLGVGAERVHHSAEEIEHVLTPEIEKELVRLLNDPKRDPHHKPIPPMEEL